ncbi:MAG: flagellar biosynthetic protein FliO [Calditrichaeota bacterium]|nr:flagellar biosynthetic protein FliO [Calditrichota bacterium]
MKKHYSKKKIWLTTGLTALFMGMFFLNLVLGRSLRTSEDKSGISLTAQFIKLFLVFGIIVLLIYGTIWFLNKFIYRRGNGSSLSHVTVLSTTLLAPKKFIYLVEVFDRLLVLGVTESQISNLTEISDPEILKTLKNAGPPQNKKSGNLFQSQLEGFLKKP